MKKGYSHTIHRYKDAKDLKQEKKSLLKKQMLAQKLESEQFALEHDHYPTASNMQLLLTILLLTEGMLVTNQYYSQNTQQVIIRSHENLKIRDLKRDLSAQNVPNTTANMTQSFYIHEEPQCHTICFADMGSANTKYKKETVCNGNISISRSQAPSFLSQYLSNSSHFSQNFIEERSQALSQEISDCDKTCALATAAFREATNGEEAARNITRDTGIEVNIISQEEEGIFAFLGAYFDCLKISNSPTQSDDCLPGNLVTWDLGGGSCQLTGLNSAEFIVYGNSLASQKAYDLINDNIKSHSTVLGADFSQEQIQQAITLLKNAVPINDNFEFIKHKLENSARLVAAGAFQKYSVLNVVNAILQTNNPGYSKKNIIDTIFALQNITPEQLIQRIPGYNVQFASKAISNLLLIYVMMDLLHIEKVSQVVDVNNADTLASLGCHVLKKGIKNYFQEPEVALAPKNKMKM